MNNVLKSTLKILFVSCLLVLTACNNSNNNPKNQEDMNEQNNTSIYPRGDKLPNEWFSGNAFLTPLVAKDNNNGFSAGSVTFEPGARTNWHTHPKGQVLLVIEGNGFYQEKGKPAQTIKKGDVVNIPENTEHWHGATATTQMVHIAITNYEDETQVTWLQPVTDKEFEEVNMNNTEQKEHYTFQLSDNVTHRKVAFNNRYGITLVADMYIPKNVSGKLAAIAVSGPFGAVKEQVSGLYAQTMAERGFLTIAFDPSYTGESGGEPRYVASPDINTEDFSAAVDFLSTRDNVDPERIGIIGICGWGGLAINAAAMDTRIKATATSTMYDMSRVNANGYFDSMDADKRYELREQLNAQRTIDAKNGTYALAGGVVDPLPDDVPWFVKDYHNYYKTKRGYHERSLNSNNGWNTTTPLSFINMPQLSYADEIRSAVLVIHGEKAHSRYFSEDAFKKLKGNNKELMIIPNATHVDLYDRMDIIPFDKLESFFKMCLK